MPVRGKGRSVMEWIILGVLAIVILMVGLVYVQVLDMGNYLKGYLEEDDEYVISAAYERGVQDGTKKTMDAVRELLLTRHNARLTPEEEETLVRSEGPWG